MTTTNDYILNLVLTNGDEVKVPLNDLLEVRPVDDEDHWIAEIFEVTTKSGETYEVDMSAVNGGTETILFQAIDPD
ncbi:MAG: hypothetical protein RMZ42_00675 [Nostoc sp. DedQUE05]|uniref:hypothetical protein n=1 Tax=Nostoc sp. DedQUE05 TaxID=3075391 RepID=UPI002AD2B5C6|nr:hypothetical protein [Nostoc sp. DedQUE05]MDZ8090454.1 hypothetical protein [Nostoc sp. DedQUE05]